MGDSLATIRRAFLILSATELQAWPTWNGPADESSLRTRTELLAKTHGLLAQFNEAGLERIAKSLEAQFPNDEVVGVERLRQAVRQPGFTQETSTRTEHGSIADQRLGCERAGRAIAAWKKHVRAEVCWTHLPPPVAGWMPEPLEDAWIDRRLLPVKGMFTNPHIDSGCSYSLPAILSSSTTCMVHAAPGGGMTSLVRWLIHAVDRGQLDGFDFPFFIDGSDYGHALSEDASLSPLDYFFSVWSAEDEDAKRAAAAVRTRPVENLSRLLIVDGWDRIPKSLQGLAWNRLQNDSCGQVNLLTSRPGGVLPGNAEMDQYQLQMFDSSDVHRRVERLLSFYLPEASAENVLDYFESLSLPLSITQNPYWLGQTVVFLAMRLSPGCRGPQSSLAQQLIAWEQERTENTPRAGLRPEHFRALGELAYSSLMQTTDDWPTFTLYDCKLAVAENQTDISEILGSRLVERMNPISGEYQFSLPSFASYFAANHLLQSQTQEAQRRFFDRTMTTPRLLPTVLEALQRDDPFRQRCRDWLTDWVAKKDGFGVLTERIAQVLIAAGCESVELDGPMSEIRRRLWDTVSTGQNMDKTRRFVRTLVDLDTDYLVRKMAGLRSTDDRRFELLLRLIPTRVLNAAGFPAIPQNCGPETDGEPAPLNTRFGGEEHLRRLAALRPDHPEVVRRLTPLMGQTIEYDIAFLLEVAQSRRLESYVRLLAIDILLEANCVIDPNAIAALLEVESELDVSISLLRLALKHQVRIDRHFLEDRFPVITDATWRRLALTAYWTSHCGSTSPSLCEVRAVVSTLVHHGFRQRDLGLLNTIWEYFVRVQPNPGTRWVNEDVERLLTAHLIQFIGNPPTNSGQCGETIPLTLMAAKFASVGNNETDVIHLCEALEIALSLSTSQHAENAWKIRELVDQLVSTIAMRDASVLISRFWEDAAVQDTLERIAYENDWLVYRDHILNAEGVVIARNSNDAMVHLRYSTPEIVSEIAETLSPRQRNDFLSYWHMVSEGDSNYHQTDRETIHRSMCMILQSDSNSSLSERLMSCYQDGSPPQFSTWKKNLNRVVNRCSNRPEWMAHLQQIGLGVPCHQSSSAAWQRKPR